MSEPYPELFPQSVFVRETIRQSPNAYALINSTGINDPKLSWAAKGVLALMISREDRSSTTSNAVNLCANDSPGEFDLAVDCLIENGYAEYVDGKLWFYDVPKSGGFR